MFFPSWNEAIKRMNKRGTKSVQWTLPGRLIRYRYIPANVARNWDGSLAGTRSDTRECLECMTWNDGQSPRYSNMW